MSERGKWNKAAGELRALGISSEAVVLEAGRSYDRLHPTWTRSPNALVGHWSEVAPTGRVLSIDHDCGRDLGQPCLVCEALEGRAG